MDLIERVAGYIKNAKHLVAFTGAGISVDSGIPPFRGKSGLWNKYDPKVLDIDYFYSNSEKAWHYINEIFYDFFGKAKPNAAHYLLAEMEQKGMLSSIITQNIDNLHTDAGSKKVYEFHGNSRTLVCPRCHKEYQVEDIDLSTIPPRCSKDQAVLKPNFVFYGEGIPTDAYEHSVYEANKADVMLIIGSTGEVMPACYLPRKAKDNGCIILEINPEDSYYSNSIVDFHIKMGAAEAASKLREYLF